MRFLLELLGFIVVLMMMKVMCQMLSFADDEKLMVMTKIYQLYCMTKVRVCVQSLGVLVSVSCLVCDVNGYSCAFT